jgi:citrate/tricarballylate utilization protein
MTNVETLVASAAGEADRLDAEGARIMQICNACRYCEGYCAVFPAMEKRLTFDAPSLAYLANLCHHCGACYYACQYAPPHEFAVNVPRVFAELRVRSYEANAWPRAFASAWRHNGAVIALSLGAGLALFFALALVFGPGLSARPAGSFYAVFPHGLLVTVFGIAFLYALLALAIGAARFRQTMGSDPNRGVRGQTPIQGPVRAALALDNLEGGGEGCYVRAGIDHPPDRLRKWFHHFTFYGFLLCFASTALATIYHYALGAPAPYPLTHPVVILGTLGGIGIVVGPAGLIALRRRHDSAVMVASQSSIDRGFTGLLLATGATGLALLWARDTNAMPILLAIHLGAVLALFVTLPYGKFVHGIYRYLALAHRARE